MPGASGKGLGKKFRVSFWDVIFSRAIASFCGFGLRLKVWGYWLWRWHVKGWGSMSGVVGGNFLKFPKYLVWGPLEKNPNFGKPSPKLSTVDPLDTFI